MKWLELKMKDIPGKYVDTVTIYNLRKPSGVYLIKRRDYKRSKLWVIEL